MSFNESYKFEKYYLETNLWYYYKEKQDDYKMQKSRLCLPLSRERKEECWVGTPLVLQR
jgi:hypothetical protein